MFLRNEAKKPLEIFEQIPSTRIEAPLTRGAVAWDVLRLCHCVHDVLGKKLLAWFIGGRLMPVDQSACFVGYDAVVCRRSLQKRPENTPNIQNKCRLAPDVVSLRVTGPVFFFVNAQYPPKFTGIGGQVSGLLVCG